MTPAPKNAADPIVWPDCRFLISAARLADLPMGGREVAIAGRSNAGKSSALNAITGRNALARTSKTPGRTQLINLFELADGACLADLPGYGFAKVPAEVQRRWTALIEHYFRRRDSLAGVVVIVDIRRGLTPLDRQLLGWLDGRPAHLLLTKSDKLSRGAARTTLLSVTREIVKAYPGSSAQLFSAKTKQGVDEARATIAAWLGLAWMVPLERRQKILGLALPIIGGMTSQNILNLVDTAMVGALGPAALAGVGMASFVNFMAVAGVTGMSSSVQAMAARRVGEGRPQESAVSLNGGLLISLLFGVPAAIILFIFSDAVIGALIDDPAVVAEGAPYFGVRALVITAVGMNFAFRGYWSAMHQTRLYMRTLIIMHGVNVFLNYTLIFGHFGAPALGTLGAGLGTAISIVLGTAIYFFLAGRHAKGNGFLERIPSREQMGSLLRLGIPAGVQQILFAGGFTALFWIIGQVGTAELAVANVLINITLVAILPGIGFGIAAATLAGQALGRSEPDDAYRWGWDVVRVGSVVFVGLGLLMLLLTRPILGIFLHEPALIDLGAWPLRLIGIGIAVDGAGLILMQSLLGAGASGTVMRVAVLMQWALFLPVAYLLGPVLGYGLFAIWMAMTLYRGGQSLIFAHVWRGRRWDSIKL